MTSPHAAATPLFATAEKPAAGQRRVIPTETTDSIPAATAQSIPRLVEALLAECTAPAQVLRVIGALLPSLGVEPTRRCQALLLLNHSFDRPSYPGLANRVGRSRPFVQDVCSGKKPSGPLREDIARVLCVVPDNIWSPVPHDPKVEQS